uniref:Poly A polymerase head domain-containing protein n=1 Tax=Strigamia maritima TaxID=126957 RepID=T1IQP8_STRMM
MKLTFCALHSRLFAPMLQKCNQKRKLHHLPFKCRLITFQQRTKFSSQAVTTKTRIPTTIKLNTPEFQAIFTPEIKNLIEIFEKHNHELRIVGGAVRDLLMQKQPIDFDLASPATPEQMKRMFWDQEFSTFKDTGETHGTVSVRLYDRVNFEISTLRIFVVENGCRSKLKFTTDWFLDASRRDLTINSMFLGFDGTVYDYFNGIGDLENRRIRFVGNAMDRIREDYLRIFRYFRFYGQIAKQSNDHDCEILETIKHNIGGLSVIAGERIWTEVKKILSGNFKFDLLKLMLEVGAGPYLGLPNDVNTKEFEMLRERAAHLSLHPVTIMTSLLKNEAEMLIFNQQMKLSNYEKELGYFLINQRDIQHENPLKSYKESVVLRIENEQHLRERIEQLLSYRGEEKLLAEFKNWETPRPPVSGHDLVARGIPFGKRMSYILMAMKKRWVQSSYTLTQRDLLDSFEEIVAQVNEQYPKPNPKEKKAK